MTSLSKIFGGHHSYAYDDLILMPDFVQGPLTSISLRSPLTPKISLALPILASPMDTVSSAEMAIGLALQGGLAFVHVNQTIEEAVDVVRKVKRFHNAMIHEPVTVDGSWTVGEARALQDRLGFTGFPVVKDYPRSRSWEAYREVVGLVSRRDMDFVDDDTPVSEVCVQMDDVIVGYAHESYETWVDRLKEHKVSRLPIIDDSDEFPGPRLVGLVCRKDIRVASLYPDASMDAHNHLRVGGTVTTHPHDQKRVDALVDAGVDVLLIDSSNGASCYQLEMLRWIHATYPDVEVICGNVVTVKQAMLLLEAGASALRVGMGVGSICTTQDVCGVGRGQASAVYHIAQFVRHAYPCRGVIADGGISSSGKMIKAFALGASAVMLGSMLAGTDEAPGDYFTKDGVRVKTYRGMGSIGAQRHMGSRVRYNGSSALPPVLVAQGVSGTVTSKGPLASYIPTLVKAVKHGLQNLGIESLAAIDYDELQAEIRTPASTLEGGIHHLFSVGSENP